jgi:DNA topoisomerase I
MTARARRAAFPPPPATDPVGSARAAGLRYVNDHAPGLRRRRAGRGFVYVDRDGRRVTDADELRRIRALAIPPAWREVWICPSPGGHIQAVGRDARGRKQYRYHPRWRALRDHTKYARMIAFAEALPRIRARVESDLARPGLPREKVIASIVRLLETTGVRVGNVEYARTNGSFGLTTLRNRHAEVSGARVRFEFRGKGGKPVSVDVTDRRVARVVARCQEVPGQELFQYVDAEGTRQTIDSADVNAYLKEVGGEEFTAKDFRTWVGTVLAARALREVAPCASKAQGRRNVTRAVEAVARLLGNTPAICRKSYVHPAVVDGYFEGRVIAPPRRCPHGLAPDEAAVLALLGPRPHEGRTLRAA